MGWLSPRSMSRVVVFPGPVGTQEAEHLALPHLEAEVIHGGLVIVDLGKILRLYDRLVFHVNAFQRS